VRVKHALLLVLLLSCHAPLQVERDASTAECTKLGATCTFAPGKLGTCVEVEHTSGPSTFVCQSQH